MINWNLKIFDGYFAPEFSSVSIKRFPLLRNAKKVYPHWVTDHLLNSILRTGYKGKWKQYGLNLILRSQQAIHYYYKARRDTLIFVRKRNPQNPGLRMYAKALSSWEFSLFNWSVAYDLVRHVAGVEFDENDKDPYEKRAYDIYNEIKHTGGHVASKALLEKHTIPMWISNEGLRTRKNLVTFMEYNEMMADMVKFVGEIKDPLTLKEILEKEATKTKGNTGATSV